MNQKLVTFLIVVIIILTGTTVYFATSKNSPTPATDTITTPTTVTTPQPLASDLKTYQNSTMGFSIKYASNWPIEDHSTDCPKFICEVRFGNSPKNEGDSEGLSNLISIQITSPEILKSNNGDGLTNCKNNQTVTLTSGLQAEKKQCINDYDGSLQYFYIIKNNGWEYQIISRKGAEAAKVFDDIANSFSFTK